ncbi:MAG: hypothetical protein M3115_00905, partial [Thermoproteota archaeon]|nr:hypothetical protein [Thermoproteota archaeon]
MSASSMPAVCVIPSMSISCPNAAGVAKTEAVIAATIMVVLVKVIMVVTVMLNHIIYKDVLEFLLSKAQVVFDYYFSH